MRTPIQAMLWELWRTSRIELAGRVAFHSLIACWCCGIGSNLRAAEADVLRGVFMMVLSIGSLFSVTWMSAFDNRSDGFCFPLTFARPISSVQLVLVPMLFTMAMAVVSFLIPAGLFTLFGGAPLPILGITTGLACAVACFIATAWSPTSKIVRWVSVILVLIGFIALLATFHIRREEPEPWLLAMGRVGYFQFAWYYYVMCLLISMIAGTVAVIGVDRQRHGDTWHVSEPVVRLLRRHHRDRSDRRTRLALKPFPSKFIAQCWYETQRVGRVVVPCAICAPLLPLAWIWSAPLFAEPAAISRGTPFIWLGFLILCPLVFHAFGADAAVGLRKKQGATWLSAFDATTPMASDQVTAIKLVSLTICSIAGWLCMLLVVSIHSATTSNWESWAQIANRASGAVGDVSAFHWFAGLAALALLYMSTSSMVLTFVLWVAKHEVPFYFMVGVGMTHGALALLADVYKWNLSGYWTVVGFGLAVGIVAVSGYIIQRAYVAGYFGKPLLQLTLVLWVIYVASNVTFYVQAAPRITSHFEIPLPLFAIALASLLVPLASTAAAPVNLDSHRHG